MQVHEGVGNCRGYVCFANIGSIAVLQFDEPIVDSLEICDNEHFHWCSMCFECDMEIPDSRGGLLTGVVFLRGYVVRGQVIKWWYLVRLYDVGRQSYAFCSNSLWILLCWSWCWDVTCWYLVNIRNMSLRCGSLMHHGVPTVYYIQYMSWWVGNCVDLFIVLVCLFHTIFSCFSLFSICFVQCRHNCSVGGACTLSWSLHTYQNARILILVVCHWLWLLNAESEWGWADHQNGRKRWRYHHRNRIIEIFYSFHCSYYSSHQDGFGRLRLCISNDLSDLKASFDNKLHLQDAQVDANKQDADNNFANWKKPIRDCRTLSSSCPNI